MYNEYQEKFYNCLLHTEYTEQRETVMVRLDNEIGFRKIVELFLMVKESGKQVFFVGNGGSCAIAEHMAADFMKNGKIRCATLLSSPFLTCMGNDFGYESVFSHSIELLGGQGDLLVTISSSGNSPNIIEAAYSARKKKMKILSLSGFAPDNRSRQLGDYSIYVPISHYGIVESIHTLLLQQVIDSIIEIDSFQTTD